MGRWIGSSVFHEREAACKRTESQSLFATVLSPMNSGFSDPNNHVPEVTPDDAWGDSEVHFAEYAQPTALLPPRRSVADKTPSPAVSMEIGLRIDTKLSQDEPVDEPRKLVVQEFNGSIVRLDQDENAPPKVDRIMTFRERPANLPSTGNTRGEGREWGRAHRGSTRWIWGMIGGVAVLVVLGIFLLPVINAPNAAREIPGSESPAISEDPTSLLVERMNRMLERQEDAARIYRSFGLAEVSDEAAPYLRDGEALKETLRANWKRLQIPKDWNPADESNWSVVELQGNACGLLQGQLPDHSSFTAYFTTDQDQLLLDWKATTGYGTSSFARLESGNCDASEIRGVITISDYYTSTFPESDYQSFRFASPDGKTTLWCYTPRDSEVFGKLSKELEPGSIDTDSKGPKKVTLRLERGPEGSLPNQWMIGGLLHLDWLSP